jgi:putative flippase GtrA
LQKVKIKEENEGGQQTVATVGGNRQEKRKRIMSYFINATIELMEKEGIENLTIRKVAEQAKYNSATLYHYFLGNILVFTSGARYEKGKELSLVFAVSIMGLAFNLILMYIFVGMMLLQPMFAKVLASCIVVIWNYLARKKWIF